MVEYEQFDPRSIQVSDAQLEAAFQAFYTFLTDSDYYNIYFDSKAQIDQLIVKQKESFKTALTLSPAAFAHHYYMLGRMHARLGITYEDLMASLEVLRDALIERGGLDPLKVFHLIDAVDQHLAHGYFEHAVEQALQEIEANRETLQVLMLESGVISLIEEPMRWLESLLKDWQEHSSNKRIPTVPEKDQPLFEMINNLPISEDSKQYIHKLHHEQVVLAQRTAHYLSMHHYIMANFLLVQLQATTMSLGNKLLCLESGLQLKALRHDPLTGLLTRHDLSLAAARVKRYAWEVGKGMAVLFLDIDHFKQINDTFGHKAGDAVLQAVGSCLAKLLRDQDVAIRYGGEEFLLLLGGVKASEACEVAERIRSAIAVLEIQADRVSLHVTASVGALYVPHATEALQVPIEVIIDQADRLLYQAKHAGRNKVCCAELERE